MSKIESYKTYSVRTIQAAVLLFAVVIIFILYSASERTINLATFNKHQSWLLIDELRETSDELTLMAKNYIIDGDPKYKKFHQSILMIRDGTMAKPINLIQLIGIYIMINYCHRECRIRQINHFCHSYKKVVLQKKN